MLGGKEVLIESFIDISGRKRAEEALRETNDYLESLFAYANAPIIVWNPSFEITRFNHAFEELTGRTELTVLGKRLEILFPPDSCDASMDLIQKALSGERWNIVEIPILQLISGEVKTVLWNSANILTLDGTTVLATIAQGQDITTRKQAEDALVESEKRYHNVVEDQTEFICRFLPDCTHIFVNDAYCRYFNMKREEIIGHRFRPVIHPEDREPVALHIASITPEHPVMTIDQRIIMPDGLTRWQRWSDRAIFDENGRVVEYQSVGRDITNTKEAEEALRQANKKLTLLSGITRHDINNKLTVLQGYLSLLEMKQLDPSLNEYCSKAATAAQRISAMIQFAKEYENIGVNAPAWQDCRTLVDTAVKQAPLGTIKVKNDLPAGAEVFADPLVVKVFYNLMDNAARYGGKITTIRFSLEECEGDPILVCEDDGVGVIAEEKEKIFERGFGENTGLGLALSREIIDITGITIKETGEPGKGARFEMTVPKGAWRMVGNGA
jgi:PAS domain S-box-containing protein